MNKKNIGKVITALGPVEPDRLGKVMMHEHLHSDNYDWEKNEMITQEKPTSPDRLAYLINQAVPLLKEGRQSHGLGAYVDVTMPPWRAWPDVYQKVSQASGVHIILATGFYREIELGKYWAKTPDQQIWPYVRKASLEELTDFCVREIVEGINGTQVHAGVIKLGTSQAPMTETEMKCFRAGARAQKATGVHITTHCGVLGAETSQLMILEEEGIDLSRVVIGHTQGHLMYPWFRKTVIEWMKRGANFLPTNLGIKDMDAGAERWRTLVEGIRAVFDAGHGDKLHLGLDSGYCSENRKFGPMTFLPPHPWTHLFTHTLPAFRKLGLKADEEKAMMETNPQRVVPVR